MNMKNYQTEVQDMKIILYYKVLLIGIYNIIKYLRGDHSR